MWLDGPKSLWHVEHLTVLSSVFFHPIWVIGRDEGESVQRAFTNASLGGQVQAINAGQVSCSLMQLVNGLTYGPPPALPQDSFRRGWARRSLYPTWPSTQVNAVKSPLNRTHDRFEDDQLWSTNDRCCA